MCEITISNLNARGEKQGIDIAKLVESKKVESLDLKGFELTEETIQILNNIPSLTTLNLYSCSSSGKINADFRKIKKLVIDNCKELDLSEIELPEEVLIVGCGPVYIARLSVGNNVKHLSIHSSEIINSCFFEKMKWLKTLNVDGSSLDNEEALKRLKIKISNEFEYHPIG